MKKKYDFSTIEGLQVVFDDAVEEMAYQVLQMTQELYEFTIKRFYDDYAPIWYRRTYATYEASSGAFDLYTPYNIRKHEDYWQTRIGVDPQFIDQVEPYRADTDWVFYRTFVKGIHGINVPRYNKYGDMKGSKKYTRVKGKENSRTFKVNLQAKRVRGKWVAQKQVTIRKYYDLNSPINIMTGIMQNQVPTPRAYMNKRFCEMTYKRELKKMFRNILDAKIRKS